MTLRIVIGGMLAGDPHQGGASWAVLQWVLGLRRLGHDVMLLEPLGARPSDEVSAYFSEVVGDHGIDDRAALVVEGTQATLGVPYAQVRAFAQSADLLLNISGMLRDDDLVGDIPLRCFVDLDPVFTQLWAIAEGIDMGFDRHTQFVTVGRHIGAGSTAPTGGIEWHTTLPPVVLEHWPVATEIRWDAMTTVANMRSYGSITHEGIHYGQKVHSLRTLADLPNHTHRRVLLALNIDPAEGKDLALLNEHGWEIVDPLVVASTPTSYRDFVAGSRAEIGVAKLGYVVARSGWFSDRSACYLASGRPVVAQDTGFGCRLPTGEGLFAFHDASGAAVAISQIDSDYPRHARAARRIAEEHLDSDIVLDSLIDRIGAC